MGAPACVVVVAPVAVAAVVYVAVVENLAAVVVDDAAAAAKSDAVASAALAVVDALAGVAAPNGQVFLPVAGGEGSEMQMEIEGVSVPVYLLDL